MNIQHKSNYIAHVREDGTPQSVLDHSLQTAKLCREFAIEPLRDLMEKIGLFHDIGKYKPAFQRKIRNEKIRVEHSDSGARELYHMIGTHKPQNLLALLAANCIAGHHSGLYDIGSKADAPDMPNTTLYSRLNRADRESYGAYKDEIPDSGLDLSSAVALIRSMIHDPKACNADLTEGMAFLTRYCLSCLGDADILDTEEFMDGYPVRVPSSDFPACLDKINAELGRFECVTELQKARERLQAQAFEKAGQEKGGIYFLNMPTGSGKTLCALKFALERIVQGKCRKLIYIAPYNSIIDQTAATAEKLFGDSAIIVRHQSTFSYEDSDDADEDYVAMMRRSCENWSGDFIISTMVQFFESICHNRKSKLRKLHNMAGSVILLDEAHIMPIPFLQPCFKAMEYLTKYLGCEIVLMTATMPDYPKLIQICAPALSDFTDLVRDKTDYAAFRRCRFQSLGRISDEKLLSLAGNTAASLVIVNQKKTAVRLYQECGTPCKFHLSTYMTPYRRQAVIERIKSALSELRRDYPDLCDVPPDRRITVFSTSLIEAGVDLDFAAVFRELTGLESILQSAGRCNREGRQSDATAYVFEREDGRRLSDVRSEIARSLIEKYGGEIDSAQCVSEYYERLFNNSSGEIFEHAISRLCKNPSGIDFRTYAEKFQMIEDRTVSIVVMETDECRKWYESLRAGGRISERQLQKYVASVSPTERDELFSQHVLDDCGVGIDFLISPDYYDSNLGIVFGGKDQYV